MSETPTVSEPAIQRGARLLAEGDAEAAVAVLRGLVAEAPVYAAAHVLLAASLDAAGRLDEGLDAWHHAAFLVPSSRLVQRKRLRLPEPEPAPPPTAPEQTEGVFEPDTSASAPAPVAPTIPDEPSAAEPDQPEAPSTDTFADVPAETHEEAHTEAVAPAVQPFASEPTPVAAPAELNPSEAAPVDAFADTADSSLPEGAQVASPDELFSEIPAEIVEANETVEPAPEATPTTSAPDIELHDTESPGIEPQDEPAPIRPASTAPPDWGDLGSPTVAVVPPDAPEGTPTPSRQDPGGWSILAERERSAPTRRGIVPPVVAPEGWTPPDEPEPVRLSGAPSVTSAATAAAPAGPSAPDTTVTSVLDPAFAATAAPQAPDSETPHSQTSAPGTPPDAASEPALADDLDALIESLDAAPRITPDPDFDGPSPDRGSDQVDDLASETLAKIYAAQHQYVEAAVVYERLAARAPENAEDLLARAAEMRRSAKS